ncbi:hypothetical protein IHE45_13G049800 [Dioscorea alata]|uniref:Uncharacterized protein n=1 Tax=Dioscorea alata TaxID=55571 RepID=A0ACB7UXZ1_DIOAL|nr:hypothetical protein IHE45_13G049800 [Dioscorea alata]
MEVLALKLKFLTLVLMAIVMVSSAADAPAPSPVSGAPVFAPAAAVASLCALVFGFFFY